MLSSQVPFNVTCDQAFIILMVAVSERKNKSLIEVSLKVRAIQQYFSCTKE